MDEQRLPPPRLARLRGGGGGIVAWGGDGGGDGGGDAQASILRSLGLVSGVGSACAVKDKMPALAGGKGAVGGASISRTSRCC